MKPAWAWGAALVAWAAFGLWYENWGGPLTAEEVATYVERLQARGEFDPQRLAVLQGFLSADDGGEFFMVNLLQLQPGEVSVAGEAPAPAREVLGRYTGYFMPALLRRAGHPVFVAPAAARYIEAWEVAPDPGWSVAGVVRYRSRRDMAELATNPAFAPAHAYKLAALASTLAFPSAPAMIVFGPRMLVPLLLLLLAALGHILLSALGSAGAAREKT